MHILGTGGGNGDAFVERTSGAKIHLQAQSANGKIGTSSNHNLGLNTNGTTRLTIDTSGRVGIGTTSPSDALDVRGSGADTYIRVGSDTAAGNDAARIGKVDSSTDFQIQASLGTTASNTVFLRNNSAEAMRIDSSGNVGIGTDSPSEPLHVNEGTGGVSTTLLLQNSSASVDGRGTNLTFKSSSTEIGQIQSKTVSGATSGILAFKTASSGTLSEQMRIDNSGNFLFATTNTSTNSNGIRFFPTGSSGGCFAEFYNGDDGQALNIGRNSNGAVTNFINGSTTVGSISLASGTTYNTSSDARLKDVTGKARGLEVIGQLNPVTYNWKESGQADEGLIAQEIEELVPNAVNQDEDGYYQMDYSKLVVHLIKAVQEQQEQIESLTSEIANLKEK